MIAAMLDMGEQYRHQLEMMLDLLQPLLWLGLCGGFVLASAHLLTMLGTRWGDRRVSPKAFLFSMAIHLSLAVAVVAMIPEYRRHMLSLGEEDPPITVKLESALDDPATGPNAGGSVPVWARLPDPQQRELIRSLPAEPDLTPESESPRTASIQLANVRSIEPVHLPQAPQEFPEATRPTEPSTQQAPALANEAPPLAPAQARPDTAPPRTRPERTVPPSTPETPEPASGAPPALASLNDRPFPRRPERVPDSPPTPSQLETPSLAAASTPPSPAVDRPAPAPLPKVTPNAAPAPGGAGDLRPDIGGMSPARSRSDIAINSDAELANRDRPGMMPLSSALPPRPRELSPLPQRDDPALPELYRPGGDPDRAVGPESLASVPASFGSRTDQERKDEAIRKYGGTEDSQRAVERALQWLVSVQEQDGRWHAARFDAGNGLAETDPKIAERQYAGRKSDTGITGLVVLALLGNGNSLREGPYSAHVDRAIRWLINQQAESGTLAGNGTVFEAMYCHGIATLALAEAYAMETDPATRSRLRPPLEKALEYSAYAQLEDGGWRYLPKQLGGGDMSMFGWQLMAFRSAQDAGLPMPEKTRSGMIAFLRERGRGPSGALAGYRATDAPTPTMSAEAFFCKQMLGLKRDNPTAVEAARYLLQNRPRLAELNLYYWYYGTLAMFQHGGTEWTQWNNAMRDLLISEQIIEGPFAGSWEPRDLYSRYGGRLYSTALCTLSLEVYYRRLPMYQWTDPAAR